MRGLATKFPIDKELLFYVADMFPSDAVYPGRPFGDMTLRLLVFDYHKRGQKCLGVIHTNIVLGPYDFEGDQLIRNPDIGTEADFILKWHTLEPIKIWGDQIDPSCLWDRNFLAYLTIANFATMQHVPEVETMRLPEKSIGLRKIKQAHLDCGILRKDNHTLEKNLICLQIQSPEIKVYLGDFEDLRTIKRWQFVDILMKHPSLLIDTINNQIALCCSGYSKVRQLPKILKEKKEQENFDFLVRGTSFLCLLALALNSKYKIPPEQTTLFIKGDSRRKWSETDIDAYHKRIRKLREWLQPGSDEFILKASTSPEGVRVGTLNPNCTFLIVADPRIEHINKQENTFENWRKSRKPIS